MNIMDRVAEKIHDMPNSEKRGDDYQESSGMQMSSTSARLGPKKFLPYCDEASKD